MAGLKADLIVTADGPLWVFTLLHDAHPVLLNLDEPGGLDVILTAPAGALTRPDG